MEPAADHPASPGSSSGLGGLSGSAAPVTSRRPAVLVEVGRRIAASHDSDTIVRDATALVAETLQADHCGMANCQDLTSEGRYWLWETSAGLSSEQEAGDKLPASSVSSLFGFAMSLKEPVLIRELAREERFIDRRLLHRGLKSALVAPLLVDGEAVGAMGIFDRRLHQFNEEDLLFTESIAHLLSSTLTRQRMQATLEQQRRLQETMLDTVDALVMEITLRGRIRWVNRACQRLTEFEPEELEDRPIWNALLIPEEASMMQTALDRAARGPTPIEIEAFLLTKKSRRRRIAWSFAPLRDPQGRVQSLLATGVDLTDLQDLQEELQRTQAVAQQFEQSLQEIQIGAPQTAVVPSDMPFKIIPEVGQRERRASPRRAYPYVQLIAPIIDNQLPDPESFREVMCRDISSGGVSFLSRVKLTHDRYVIAFGTPPLLTYVTAEVVHQTPMMIDNRPQIVIGCRYTGRIQYPPK